MHNFLSRGAYGYARAPYNEKTLSYKGNMGIIVGCFWGFASKLWLGSSLGCTGLGFEVWGSGVWGLGVRGLRVSVREER